MIFPRRLKISTAQYRSRVTLGYPIFSTRADTDLAHAALRRIGLNPNLSLEFISDVLDIVIHLTRQVIAHWSHGPIAGRERVLGNAFCLRICSLGRRMVGICSNVNGCCKANIIAAPSI